MNIEQETPRSGDRQAFIWGLLAVVVVTLVIVWGIVAVRIQKLESATEGLNFVEYISTGTQRLVKLEIMGIPNDEIIFHLDITSENLLPDDRGVYPYFNDDPAIRAGISDMYEDWTLLKSAIYDLRDNQDATAALSASERHFYHSASLSHLVVEEVTKLSNSIAYLQLILMSQIIIIVLIVAAQIFRIWTALHHSRALSNAMMLDATTGLYNRSKCQDMLRSSDTPQTS